VGMDEETLRRCFDPFFTTKGVEGTGLGLALSWSIARRQNGELTVESALGSGTCFTLWLPIAIPGTAPASRPPTIAASNGAPRRVLVIDDRPDVVGTVTAMLRQLDHTVESAGSGAEGLDL